MADARTEQILAAIETALTGLTTTGANVQRSQIHPHESTKLPALAIYQGADVLEAEHQTGILDWTLTVAIESVAKLAATYTTYGNTIEASLAQIRKEVHIAIMADHTLGLAFVIDVSPGQVEAPILEGDGKVPVGSQVIQYQVHYRSSRTDISED